ncbi:MAG: hypothetical protein IJ088_13290 [Clostridia bacterium]|nr:hypothetical protein [Clostridia bacterium]
MEMDELWERMTQMQGQTLTTSGRGRAGGPGNGMPFTFTVRGRTLQIDRKTKSLTWATVELALRRAGQVQAEEGYVKGPKKLGVFGASYLYPIFAAIGVIRTVPPAEGTE